MQDLFVVALLATMCSSCAARGLPLTGQQDSSLPADMGVGSVPVDLSTGRFDFSVAEDASAPGPTALSDLAMPADLTLAQPPDLAEVPDLANSCGSLVDCPSLVCNSGQCASHYNDDCSTATPLVFVNGEAIVQSTLVPATNGNLPTDVSPTCSQDAKTFGADAVYYFDLSATTTLVIDEWDPRMTSELYPVLYVRYGTCDSPLAADEVACGSTTGGTNYTYLYLTDLAPGRYYVWADSRGSVPAAYLLRVSIQ